MRWTVPVPMPSDLATFKIPTPFASCFRTLRLVALWRDRDEYGKCVKLLILAGARREEIGGIRWSEINLDKATWTLPAVRIHI